MVTPAYNEEAILTENLGILCSYMESLEDRFRWELVIVDDGSRDRTAELADAFAEDRENVRVVHHRVNLGLGRALRTAFEHCRGEYVVTFDVDLSYTPDHIERLLERILDSGASVVVASPYMAGGSVANVPLKRLLASRWANRLLSVATTARISTLTGMVRVYSAELLRRLDPRATGMEINPEIIYKAVLLRERIEEIPARLEWRPAKPREPAAQGSSAQRSSSMKMARQTASVLMSGFLFRPVTLLVAPGILILLFAVYVNAWMLVHFLGEYLALPGEMWIFDRASAAVEAAFRQFPHTFVVGGIALMLGVQMIGLGVLALQARAYFEELFHLGTTIHGHSRRDRWEDPGVERRSGPR
ncbi:MAG: glycosyltransferase family 2 protein [bacterium]|nr:glycosyltransferase family 2 protein [bacterium]